MGRGIQKDLAVGRIGEDYVIEVISEAGYKVERNEDKKQNKYFDLTIFVPQSRIVTAEVKTDIYAAKSGNVAFEYFNPKSNNPSGLYITKADFWIHILTDPNRIFITRVDKLKEFVSNNKPFKVIDFAGDGNASLMLYTIENGLSTFKQLTRNNAKELILELVDGN